MASATGVRLKCFPKDYLQELSCFKICFMINIDSESIPNQRVASNSITSESA